MPEGEPPWICLGLPINYLHDFNFLKRVQQKNLVVISSQEFHMSCFDCWRLSCFAFLHSTKIGFFFFMNSAHFWSYCSTSLVFGKLENLSTLFVVYVINLPHLGRAYEKAVSKLTSLPHFFHFDFWTWAAILKRLLTGRLVQRLGTPLAL